MEFLNALHFLRPWWLLSLPFGSLLYYLNVRNRSKNDPAHSTFAPHLLPYLLVPESVKNRFRPNQMLLIFWLLAGIALAGPTWQREPSPFAEDQASLVIVLKNTPSMLAKDIQPSRLERSTHKIKDLLQSRQGAQTALITYAGSSHLVMPLTRDSSIIVTFAGELDPEIMPKEGDVAAEALLMAADVLEKSESGGSILLITDSLGTEMHQALAQAADKVRRYPVNILAVAALPGSPVPADSQDAPPLDVATLRAGANIIDGNLVVVSHDSADVEKINANIVHHNKLRLSAGEDERWRDMGYALLPLLMLLCLFWSRKGWYVRWEVR